MQSPRVQGCTRGLNGITWPDRLCSGASLNQAKLPGDLTTGWSLRSSEGKQWKGGGRYRIRTYDFHRVKMALYR
jgi:hypothetical protein